MRLRAFKAVAHGPNLVLQPHFLPRPTTLVALALLA